MELVLLKNQGKGHGSSSKKILKWKKIPILPGDEFKVNNNRNILIPNRRLILKIYQGLNCKWSIKLV